MSSGPQLDQSPVPGSRAPVMLALRNLMSSRPIQWRITVRGRLAPHWSRWLGEFQLSYRATREDGTVTDLQGTVADQSALQGVLNRIWKLNLTVLEVRSAADAREEEEPVDPGG